MVADYIVREDDDRVFLETPQIEAAVRKRGYVCMIEEFGGKPVRPGESFSAAFIVGYFDSIEEVNRVCDRHCGYTALDVAPSGWRLTR